MQQRRKVLLHAPTDVKEEKAKKEGEQKKKEESSELWALHS